MVIVISQFDVNKQVKALLRKSELNSGMANKRKHQVHKDKNTYSRKLKHKTLW
jgi:hypothetical protein